MRSTLLRQWSVGTSVGGDVSLSRRSSGACGLGIAPPQQTTSCRHDSGTLLSPSAARAATIAASIAPCEKPTSAGMRPASSAASTAQIDSKSPSYESAVNERWPAGYVHHAPQPALRAPPTMSASSASNSHASGPPSR